MKYEALTTIVPALGAAPLPPGSIFELKDKAEAESLIAAHHIKEAPAGAAAAAAAAPKKPGSAAKIQEQIVAAIAKLTPADEEQFTQAGKPIVAALEKQLGYDISGEERDAAWETCLAKNPDLFKRQGGGQGGDAAKTEANK